MGLQSSRARGARRNNCRPGAPVAPSGRMQRPRNPYSSAEIDRSSHERENEERMIELASSGAARFVPIDIGANLVSKGGGNPEAVFLQGMMARAVASARRPSHLPGLCRGHAVLRRRRHRQGDAARRDGRVRRPAPGRRAAVRARRLDPGLCPRHDLLASPPPLLRRLRLASTRVTRGGHVRMCTNESCKTEHFPRTDPAVIMLVHHGDKCLLGRGKQFPQGHALDPGGLRRAGRELRGRGRARGLRGGEGAGEERHLPFLAALAVPGLGDDRLPCRGRVDWTSRSTRTSSPRRCWLSREELRPENLPKDGSFFMPRRNSIARRLIEEWLGHEAGPSISG